MTNSITYTLSHHDDGYHVRDWFISGDATLEAAMLANTVTEAESILRDCYLGPDRDGVDVTWRIVSDSITRAQRALIKAYLSTETKYDASTLRITRQGQVSARLDVDKTFAAPAYGRMFVGWLDDILAEATALSTTNTDRS